MPKGRRSCVKYISKERINNESMPCRFFRRTFNSLIYVKTFLGNKDRFWVTFDKEDARSLLDKEKMYPCYYPTNRSLKALLKKY